MTLAEQHRAECEARYWLRETGGDKAQVIDLHRRIKKKRGQAAADKLITDMRSEWKKIKCSKTRSSG